MNSQRQNESNRKAASAVFTKETTGVIIILFSTLCLICLITKDAVFSAPGKYVGDFLMGVFGFFAFPLSAWAIFEGALLTLDKKIGLSLKRKALICLSVFTVMLFAHIVSMGGGYDSYGEYISASYSRGENAFSAGGVVAGLIAYFLQALLTVVGSAVITGVLFGISAYFLATDIIKDKKGVSTDREFRSTFVKNQAPEPQESLKTEDVLTAAPAPEKEYSAKPAQRLFINNGDDFSFKSKREMSKDAGSAFKVDSTPNTLNVSAYTGSYSEKYNSDLQKKIEYVKTPAKINVQETVKPLAAEEPRVSDYISARTETPRTDVAADSEEIPMIEHEETFRSGAESRADEFSEKYASAEFDGVTETDKPDEAPIAEENEYTDTFRAEERFGEPVKETEPEPAAEEDAEIEEPPAPRIRGSRVREILFDDEKPSFTSRVQADDNARGANFGAEKADFSEPEPVAEEPPAPPKPPVPINRTYYKPPLDLLETYAPPADAPKENHE